VVVVGGGVGIALALSGHSSSSTHNQQNQQHHASPPAVPSYHSISLASTYNAKGYVSDYSVFSPDGKLIAADLYNSSTVTEKYFVWSTVSHQLTQLDLPQYATGMNPPALSADDQSLVAVTYPAKTGTPPNSPLQVLSWNIATGQSTTVLSVTSPESQFINALNTTALSGDGNTVAIEDPARTGTDLYNLKTAAKITEIAETDSSAITGITTDNDGHEVAVSHQDGTTYVRNTAGKLLATFHFNDKSSVKDVTALPPELSPDGMAILIFPNGDFSGPDAIWSVATQRDITPQSPDWPSSDVGGAFSANGQLFVNDDGNGGANIWDVATGKHLYTIAYPGRSSSESVGALSASGRELAAADLSTAGKALGRLDLWNLQ
jgi:YD repeat-containing protein